MSEMPKLAVRIAADRTMPLYQFVSNIREGKVPIYRGGELIGWASKHEPMHRAVARINPSLSSAGQSVTYLLDDGERFRAEYTAYVLR